MGHAQPVSKVRASRCLADVRFWRGVMRILVVENDRLLSEALAQRLTQAGHAVDVFATVADADAAWKIAVYDLCIVDVMLDDGDGRALDRKSVV